MTPNATLAAKLRLLAENLEVRHDVGHEERGRRARFALLWAKFTNQEAHAFIEYVVVGKELALLRISEFKNNSEVLGWLVDVGSFTDRRKRIRPGQPKA